MPTEPPIDSRRLLGPMLKDVSRSIYLSVRVMPRAVRVPIGTAYLFARAADTIADTRLLPPGERLEHLAAFRAQFDRVDPARLAALGAALTPHQSIPGERLLLSSLPELFDFYSRLPEADRRLIADLMHELPDGMAMDLAAFPPEEGGPPAAIASDKDLDRYCYLVAGTAGKFWTRVLAEHSTAIALADRTVMIDLGIRYGKGLQMVNVLRDIPRDLAIRRCYIPQPRLAATRLAPTDLCDPTRAAQARPILLDLIALALEHLDAGRQYCRNLPARTFRVRLATLWPLLIAYRTLALLAAEADWLNPKLIVRDTRGKTKRLLLASALRAWSGASIDRMTGRLGREAQEALSHARATSQKNG